MFVPQRILFEKNVMGYDIAQNIYNEFKDNKKIEIIKEKITHMVILL